MSSGTLPASKDAILSLTLGTVQKKTAHYNHNRSCLEIEVEHNDM